MQPEESGRVENRRIESLKLDAIGQGLIMAAFNGRGLF